VQKRALRWSEGACVLEGPDLVVAALESGTEFEALYLDERALTSTELRDLAQRAHAAGVRTFVLDEGVLEKVADAQTPQPVIASVRFTPVSLEQVSTDGFVLVLDNVRDPGNAGTIIRSADAAGAAAVLFTGECVDPYNPKTLRASAGSVFHVPLVRCSFAEAYDTLHARAVPVYATVVRGGASPRGVDLSGAAAVVIGNEAQGLSDEVIERCDGRLSIPMAGRSESLNAGVAASLVAFEALNQRLDTIA
jgi:TrmH family RNA methyltransferase